MDGLLIDDSGCFRGVRACGDGRPAMADPLLLYSERASLLGSERGREGVQLARPPRSACGLDESDTDSGRPSPGPCCLPARGVPPPRPPSARCARAPSCPYDMSAAESSTQRMCIGTYERASAWRNGVLSFVSGTAREGPRPRCGVLWAWLRCQRTTGPCRQARWCICTSAHGRRRRRRRRRR
jgi:hypothetical protein